MQRLFDILFSSFALFLLLPIFLPVIIILRFTGEGEIFFLQDRLGRQGNYFKLYKFATMLKNSPNISTGTLTTKDDPRILPIGKFLRKSKVNELPQLINIMIGDMSIVGPRPLTQEAFGEYSDSTQRVIEKVKPGLSGIGSIFFRDEENILDRDDALLFYSKVIAPYKGDLEKWYVKNQNIKIYFLVILVTVWIIIFSKSNIAWIVFRSVPKPPPELIDRLNYKNLH